VTHQIFFFRPGEESRMLARCQFGLKSDGECGAILTYPMKGLPWRRNPAKSYEFHLDATTTAKLFEEVRTLKASHPQDCLAGDELWNDASEKANGVTRDKASGTLCYTIALIDEGGMTIDSFSMRENSDVLVRSMLFRTVADLVRPFEQLPCPGGVA
jgi:hypothetical protein